MTTSLARRVVGSSLLGLLLAVTGCEQGPATSGEGEPSGTSAALTQDHVLPTGSTCTPTGAHGKHAFTSCSTCHVCGGVLQFDPTGAAVAAGQPLPAFDAVSKTCSNVACHSVPSGTFSYYTWDEGTGESVLHSVPYGGGGAQTTPGWYTTGAACGSCHGMPASQYIWHSGVHGYPTQYATTNACQTCHQDATGLTDTSGVVTDAAIVTTATCGPLRNQPCPPYHGNGTVDVTPRFTSGCLGCH